MYDSKCQKENTRNEEKYRSCSDNNDLRFFSYDAHFQLKEVFQIKKFLILHCTQPLGQNIHEQAVQWNPLKKLTDKLQSFQLFMSEKT